MFNRWKMPGQRSLLPWTSGSDSKEEKEIGEKKMRNKYCEPDVLNTCIHFNFSKKNWIRVLLFPGYSRPCSLQKRIRFLCFSIRLESPCPEKSDAQIPEKSRQILWLSSSFGALAYPKDYKNSYICRHFAEETISKQPRWTPTRRATS